MEDGCLRCNRMRKDQRSNQAEMSRQCMSRLHLHQLRIDICIKIRTSLALLVRIR